MRWTRLLCVIVLAALVAVACGLAVDESPRLLTSQEIPPELRPDQPTPTPVVVAEDGLGPGTEQIHMVLNGRLVTVQRPIAEEPEELVEILRRGTFPEEAANGIRTALNFRTQVQQITVAELSGVAVVDLAPGSLDPSNSEQRIAFAQIVYTLTSLQSIDAVQFVQTDPDNPQAGPIDLAVQTDDGTTLPGARVTRDDFALLEPTSLVAEPQFGIPITTPTPTPDPDAPPIVDLLVWMLDSNSDLIEVARTAERTPEGLLFSVVDGVTVDEREMGVRSALPPDALVDSISIENFEVDQDEDFGFGTLIRANIAMVDLTAGSLPSVDNEDERYLAAAQIVYTLTGLEEIDQVVFSVDGVPLPMPSDRGLTLPFDPNIARGLDRDDYISALPVSEQPTAVPVPLLTPTPLPTPGG